MSPDTACVRPKRPKSGICMARDQIDMTPLQSRDELVAWLEAGAKPPADFRIGTRLGIGFLGLGMTPSWSRAQIPMMPKGRYKIMTDYMPKVGRYGLDMMYRTCTVQTNLDFSSEADMVRKLRVSVALQPVATA